MDTSTKIPAAGDAKVDASKEDEEVRTTARNFPMPGVQERTGTTSTSASMDEIPMASFAPSFFQMDVSPANVRIYGYASSQEAVNAPLEEEEGNALAMAASCLTAALGHLLAASVARH